MKNNFLIYFFNNIIYILYQRCIKSNENSFSVLYCVEVLDLFCWKLLGGRVCFILLVSTNFRTEMVWKIQFSHHSAFIVLHLHKLCSPLAKHSFFTQSFSLYWVQSFDFVFSPTSLNFNKFFVCFKDFITLH